ncbi:hypothetical protein SADUNF_Sadunf11G0034200 [Salix dunnii]|uniref:SBP-type domain-containing protein n=1 Tax=Salix dunnii TaxID=1413687 RepID=A0A835MT02_9ROSI|nr:hypothetical protein SADUNF_Sadunf11G0034200 [Salix dunnii]
MKKYERRPWKQEYTYTAHIQRHRTLLFYLFIDMETSKAEGKRSSKEIEDEEEEEDDEDFAGGLGFVEDDKIKKKGKRGSSGGGSSPMVVVSCQADNCTSDLTDAKRYHRRHKVCEVHAKAPFVPVNGHQQRFCQQCSR